MAFSYTRKTVLLIYYFNCALDSGIKMITWVFFGFDKNVLQDNMNEKVIKYKIKRNGVVDLYGEEC